MKDEIKEIYLSNLEWTKTHDNIGGVMGNVIFKGNISYEEYSKLVKSGYFNRILCDKDYITNLQKENKHLNLQLGQALKDYDELQERIDKAIEEINYMITNVDITEISAIKLEQILGDKENE